MAHDGEIVLSRYFTRQYAADALPVNTRTDAAPEYLKLLRHRQEREEKRKRRLKTSSPLTVPSKQLRVVALEPTCPTRQDMVVG
jgi:hypothetical protein